MNITKVIVCPHNQKGKLKAFATIVIEHCFIIHELKLIEGEHGLFVSMPSRRHKSGGFKEIAHPLNFETRRAIEEPAPPTRKPPNHPLKINARKACRLKSNRRFHRRDAPAPFSAASDHRRP